MIDSDWILSNGTAVFSMLISALGIYAALLLFTRLAGLRSFSKMSSFDFAITVAFGSTLASTLLSKDPALLTGALALAVLFGMQYAVALGRRSSSDFRRLVDNEPLLLMAGGQLLQANMDAARVTESDLNAKLRMHGVAHRDQVRAVILETTGDVSVLRADQPIDDRLLADVRDSHRIPGQADPHRPTT
ncbi:YetF domain-containing protein [Salinisphaera sp. SPP-AMP-43]|uniref:DUF421 domain-containing protein n=1 Tax=Salinisphaera sp. SPP-AMP-43 TaxID=3121288 RepID=UPI003C6E3937